MALRPCSRILQRLFIFKGSFRRISVSLGPAFQSVVEKYHSTVSPQKNYRHDEAGMMMMMMNRLDWDGYQ